jgi:hypothetical protein
MKNNTTFYQFVSRRLFLVIPFFVLFAYCNSYTYCQTIQLNGDCFTIEVATNQASCAQSYCGDNGTNPCDTCVTFTITNGCDTLSSLIIYSEYGDCFSICGGSIGPGSIPNFTANTNACDTQTKVFTVSSGFGLLPGQHVTFTICHAGTGSGKDFFIVGGYTNSNPCYWPCKKIEVQE